MPFRKRKKKIPKSLKLVLDIQIQTFKHQNSLRKISCGTYTPWTITQPLKKNSFESVLMRSMKLEPILQSEVSQKDKDQFSILTHIYGI